MNRPTPFTATDAHTLFKPAFQYLHTVTRAAADSFPGSSTRSGSSSNNHRRDSSLDEPADEYQDVKHSSVPDWGSSTNIRGGFVGGHKSKMSHSSQNSYSELHPGGVPLIDLSRSSSPYPRTRSAAQSEDEDDDFEPASSVRPLVASDIGSGGSAYRKVFRNGGLGEFLFGSWIGWQIYVGLLVFWVGGCGFGLLLMNRFILWTGVYKFPYPLTATYIQLIITHILLLGCASLTRGLAGPLRRHGFSAAIAPSVPRSSGARAAARTGGTLHRFGQWLSSGTGGIAGGGLFEFDRQTVKYVLPLALVHVGKVVLSNLSFAYAVLPMYTLARIGVVPLSLIFTSVLNRDTHSVATLSSTLTATLNLLLASIRPGVRVTWESIVAGVFSSFFVALYPVILLRTYRTLVSELVPQGDVLTGFVAATGEEASDTREESRAYWRTMHYTSLLSILILTPIVLLSGEIRNIASNCYFLDVPFFWFLTLCGGIGSSAVFSSTLLLVKATSPLTVSFVATPKSAFQLLVLSQFKMPVHSWIGVVMCWISSLWFLVTRRAEGRRVDRVRMEGR